MKSQSYKAVKPGQMLTNIKIFEDTGDGQKAGFKIH
jgi:hypothetical protein